MVTKKRSSKPLWRSKTFWLNVLGIGGAVVAAVASSGVAVPAVITSVLAALNITLRTLDTAPDNEEK